MMSNLRRIGLFLALGFCLVGPGLRAAERVQPLDLSAHLATDKVDLKALAPGEYEWSLPTGAGQKLTLDLQALGIDAGDYDELRFEIKPLGSQVGLHTVIENFPQEGQRTSWYLKFKAETDQWSEGRYDLHLDDDGSYIGKPETTKKLLVMNLYRRLLGYPGEPRWRKAVFRNVRLVKHVVSARFTLKETEVLQDEAEVAYVYHLHLKNRTDKPQQAKIDLDPTGALRHFRATCPETELTLKPGEEKVLPVRIFIPVKKASHLPPLYAEPLFPRVSVPGVQDSDVVALKGYRRWPMWGAVPIFVRHTWTPPEMQALLEAREKVLPGVKALRQGTISGADAAMKYRWPVPDFGPPLHDQGYRCDKCKDWLTPATPTSLHKHVCPHCGVVFENNDYYDRTWLMRYNSGNAQRVRTLALAWLMTDKPAYAEKAAEILLDYADMYPKMPNYGTRSTSSGTKLGANSLHSSYVVPLFAEGYAYLRGAPCLDETKRARIEGFIKEIGIDSVQHSVEYNNQQAEHFRAYGTAGLAIGFWPLAAETIAGEFGFHEVAEYGYSEDGIAHEAGAYHRSVFFAMHSFAAFAYGEGLNLFTYRYKRVFDGSIDAGFAGPVDASYELPFLVYRDPKYLPIISTADRGRDLVAALHGVDGLPDVTKLPAVSVHQPGAGYIYLRKGSAADWMGISLNYIKQFDRSELDRFTTFFLRTGAQVDSTVGRITYSAPQSWWMTHTAAHNAIVIDGESERETEGRLVAIDLSPENPIAVVATDPQMPFYEGVDQLRCIALLGSSYVVFDRVSADKAHTIDRYQYGKPPTALKSQAAALQGLPPGMPARGEFSQMEGGPCGRELRIDFGNDLKMRLASDGDMSAYKGITVGTYQATPMEFTFARRDNAKEATFLAAFTLGKETEPPALRIVKSEPEEQVFEVKTADKSYTVTIKPGQQSVSVKAP